MLKRLIVVFTVLIGISGGVIAGPVSIVALVINNTDSNAETETFSLAMESLGARILRFDAVNASEIRSAVKVFSEAAAENDVAVVYLDGALLQSDGRDFFAPDGLSLHRKSDLLTQTIPLSAFVRASDLAQTGGAVLVHSTGQGVTLIDGVSLVQTAPEIRAGANAILVAEQGVNALLVTVVAQQAREQTVNLSAILLGLAMRPGITASRLPEKAILLREPAPVMVPTVVATVAPVAVELVTPVIVEPVAPVTVLVNPPVNDPVVPVQDQPASGLNLPQIQPVEIVDPVEAVELDQPVEIIPPETQTDVEPALTLEMLTEMQNGLSRLEKRNVQAELKLRDFYDGTIDGLFGPGTARAISAYQEFIGAEVTGVLTILQLEDLT